MAQTITKISQTKVLNQLDTYNHTALSNSMYVVTMKLSEQPPSGMSIVIQQNGVTKASLASPSVQQNHMELIVQLNCSISDVISVILSSSAAIDQLGNSFKGILKI